jgi:hypothetical protein
MVGRVPEDDHVDDETEISKLVFLALSAALTQFTAFDMEDCPAQAVPSFSRLSWPSALRRLLSSSSIFRGVSV